MIVVDTSAVVAALTAGAVADPLRRHLGADGDLHAPHLIDVEFLHVLRRMVARGRLTAARAAGAREDFALLRLTRYPHHALADRVWEMRNNLTAYDACFVVLSEVLGAALVTCDRRLATAPGHRATVELFPSS